MCHLCAPKCRVFRTPDHIGIGNLKSRIPHHCISSVRVLDLDFTDRHIMRLYIHTPHGANITAKLTEINACYATNRIIIVRFLLSQSNLEPVGFVKFFFFYLHI
jgi:hypothetical protein